MEKLTYKKAGIYLAYPMAYLFFRSIINDLTLGVAYTVLFTVVTVAFCILNEIILRGHGKTTTKEGYFWYGAAVLASVTISIAPEEFVSHFGWFLCMVFATVTAGDTSLDGHGYSFILKDLVRGIFMPLKNLEGLGKEYSEVTKEEAEIGKKKVNAGSIVKVAIIMFVILVIAFFTLCTLDEAFDRIASKLVDYFEISLVDRVINMIICAVFAIPGMYIFYGFFSGFASISKEKMGQDIEEAKAKASSKRNVGHIVFDLFTGLFIVMYGIFFGTHTATILHVFKGTSPDGMLLSTYARTGFFSLVFIMVLNALVFLVLLKYGRREDGKFSTITRILMTILFVETIIFAALSFGRLAIYFSAYGYTPKRMLAMWGTLVMTVASAVIIMYVNRKPDDTRSYMRFWTRFTTVSYILMCLATAICKYIFWYNG